MAGLLARFTTKNRKENTKSTKGRRNTGDRIQKTE
jgi:hypothetical protein